MARPRPDLPELTATALAPAGRGGAARSAYDVLRNAVLDCTFLPGMALSEQAVSDQLGMSRAPVREAFRQLVVEGLLETQPQRGTFVARLNRVKIADAVFAREAIECAAVGKAARAPLAQRAQLNAIVSRQAQASARRDYATHLATDEEFHQRLLEAAGHPHVWPVLRLARTGMNRIRHLAIPAVGSHRIAIDQHRLIVEAIVAGDSVSAVRAMREHVRSPLDFVGAIETAHPEYFEPG